MRAESLSVLLVVVETGPADESQAINHVFSRQMARTPKSNVCLVEGMVASSTSCAIVILGLVYSHGQPNVGIITRFLSFLSVLLVVVGAGSIT